MRPFLFNLPILPDEFRFPRAYESCAQSNGLPQIEPWSFLCWNMPAALRLYGLMLERFTQSPLVPFALLHDMSGFYNDGQPVVASFDGSNLSGDPRVLIYDFSTPKITPWQNKIFPNFETWLDTAKIESHEYKLSREEAKQEA